MPTKKVTLDIDERILSDIGTFQHAYLFNNRSLAISWLLAWSLKQQSRYEVALRAPGRDDLTENDLKVSFKLTDSQIAEQQITKEGDQIDEWQIVPMLRHFDNVPLGPR